MVKRFLIKINGPNKNNMVYPEEVITDALTDAICTLPEGVPIVNTLTDRNVPFIDPNSGGIENGNVVGKISSFIVNEDNTVSITAVGENIPFEENLEVLPIGWAKPMPIGCNVIKEFTLMGFVICKKD